MTKTKPPGGPPTIRDVARHSGVSIGTVSRSLNNQPGIHPETRGRVLQSAQELGYPLSKLRASRPRRLCVLYHRDALAITTNPFYNYLFQGIEEACRSEKTALSIASLREVDEVADLIRRQEAQGLICVGYLEPELLGAVQSLGLPLVLIDHWQPNVPCLNSDHFLGSFLATQHLIDQGYQRIAFLHGSLMFYSTGQRLQGYRHALVLAGRSPTPDLEVLLEAGDENAAVAQVVAGFLALPPRQRPDAVVVYNDATALRVISAIQAAGLRVPEDLGITGFDDLDAATSSFPTLTTVQVDNAALGKRGVEALLERLPEAQSLVMSVRLMVRQSSVKNALKTQASTPAAS